MATALRNLLRLDQILELGKAETTTAASGLRCALRLVGLDVCAQTVDDLVFLPFVDLFLHFFEGKVHDVVVVQLLRGQTFAESQP